MYQCVSEGLETTLKCVIQAENRMALNYSSGTNNSRAFSVSLSLYPMWNKILSKLAESLKRISNKRDQ